MWHILKTSRKHFKERRHFYFFNEFLVENGDLGGLKSE